ncbi:uncharacterized protein EV154DRAFT_488160 [Mucor mucedo]|uniref:uncharacterized protein n=1 Tax=Mucor mucedo TaxID=29922 RepID=UPI0022204FAB|nr:uncharacterized protein EV154DRAFT_488160 [Mucor mucedo]KAI7868384.1 hypothetical protein EV154DRAFT_488160 [Mucor mucedo]
MSDMNIALTDSVRKIELDITEINQILAALSDQFKNQFARNITDEDVNTIQKSIVEQSARDRITESVKRSQVIEYPDQLGKRTIDPNSEEFKGKKISDRLNELLQRLHTKDWQLFCKDIPDEQQKPPPLKSLAQSLKHDLIDLDQPDVLKNSKDKPANDRDFYMLRQEKLANDKGFKIYQYSDCSNSINNAFENMGRDESPIIADVLLQITMVRVYSTFKITESVNKNAGIGLLRESKNIITATFTSQENGSCE